MLTLNNFFPRHDQFLLTLVTKHLTIRAIAHKELNQPTNWRWQAYYLTLFYNRLHSDQLVWGQQKLMAQQETEETGYIWQNEQTGHSIVVSISYLV